MAVKQELFEFGGNSDGTNNGVSGAFAKTLITGQQDVMALTDITAGVIY